MPAHIYTRVGRYGDAADANERAIAADRRYFANAPKPGFYNIYYVHNVHFLAYAAMMEGRYETAMAAARRLEKEVPEDFLHENANIADGLMATPLHVLIRFGKWDEILREPEFPEFRKLSRAQRRYARAVALAALGRPQEAREELAAFEQLAAQVPEDWKVGNNKSGEVIELCRQMMMGEILFREGRLDEAFAALAKGAELEDALVYDEPPGWMQPVRHAWGALLMSAGRRGEAQRVYREDLERNPGNGWSLLGLELALRAGGEDEEAERTAKALEAAWERADVRPTSSCFCEPGERLAAR
jgi:tetratricopeptide (TPR) repeat protein